MQFVLLKRTPANPSSKPSFEWRHLNGDRLYNNGGGWNRLSSNDEIIETLELKNWDELWTPENTAKTTEYQNLVEESTDKSLKIGWLAPNGKMHYCRYANHITYVHIVLDSDVPTIEEQGWLHIYAGMSMVNLRNGRRITHEQARTLREELDINVNDEDILY